MQHYDVIVLGVGGVGSAALFHLARRNARVLGIDRFPPGHDRGSSHGQSRLIRQAYFEHPDYVPLLLRAYDLWRDLEGAEGQRLFEQVGLLQVGPPEGDVIQGVCLSARLHNLEIERLAPAEARARFEGFVVPDDMAAVFERRAGYLLVERCVEAHAKLALSHGAQLAIGPSIRGWSVDGALVTVKTDAETYTAERLIVTAGAWAGSLLADLGLPLVVRRKPLFWFQPRSRAYHADHGAPGFYYELPHGSFYGVPRIDDLGVKVAEHTGGREVVDPLALDRTLDTHDQARVAQFVANYLPEVDTEVTHHVVCMYTLTPDEHFIVDRHPEYARVVFAAGLSGHGFKFTSVLGEALAQLALDGQTPLPIGFLSLARPAIAARM